MSFRQFIQSCFFCFISCLCLFFSDVFQTINSEFYWLYKLSLLFCGKREGSTFLLNFFAVFRNSMNVIANVKKLFGFFVIDGKGRVGIRAILENGRKGVLTSARLTDTKWGGSGLRLVRRSGLTLVVGRHVTIGRVLFSDPIAFVDAVIRRIYSNLMIFCFT